MRIRPARRLRGHIGGLPGDKSISHRAAIIAALARGRTRVRNFSTSADCASTLECLRRLGVQVEREGDSADGALIIDGAGGEEAGRWSLRAPEGALDCGNSGTTMRLLAGVLAAQDFTATLTGDASLSERPMRRVVEPLELMGARVQTEEGHAPLRVEGRRPLRAVTYEMPVASAQVKSCILLAGLGAEGDTRVVEQLAPTRDHTERLLEWFGARVRVQDAPEPNERRELSAHQSSVTVEGPALLRARDVTVPGDISSAAFLLAASALLPESDLFIDGVGLNPTRAGIVRALRALGADIRVVNAHDECNELVGGVRVRGAGALRRAAGRDGAGTLRGAAVARLIDELPVLAVVGTQVEGGLEIRDAGELRVKESDRIDATVRNLRAMGAEVEEFDDGLRVGGPTRLRGARLASFGDHRIAMAFTVAALVASGESLIEGAGECVPVSFPEFYELLESVVER
ncbi:MAG TPA: 3-phosphoshikimate 1-carboxyvinyltransferase [Pyrinomonadaceae bacterium]